MQAAKLNPGRPVRESRLVLVVSAVVVMLLGPVFTAGYAVLKFDGLFPRVRVSTAQTAAAAAAPAPQAPKSGDMFLQLVATPRYEGMMQKLRTSGFQAVASEVPKSNGVYRVLVGPFPASEIARIRGELEQKGFPGEAAIARKSSSY